jgi:hypothetical protein
VEGHEKVVERGTRDDKTVPVVSEGRNSRLGDSDVITINPADGVDGHGLVAASSAGTQLLTVRQLLVCFDSSAVVVVVFFFFIPKPSSIRRRMHVASGADEDEAAPGEEPEPEIEIGDVDVVAAAVSELADDCSSWRLRLGDAV